MPTAAPPGVVAALPFTSSAHEHTEPAFTVTVTPGAAEQVLNPIDIPAYGYIRSLFLEVSASGGAGGTLGPDAPWSGITNVTLQDVNGTNIVGPIDGYSLYIANIVHGWQFRQNPADAPFYVGSAPNPVFFLRVPVEISAHDGLGCLANQNSAANFRLNLSIGATTSWVSSAWTTVPTITIRGWLEAWTLPAPSDGRGRPQAQTPPLLGTGMFLSTYRQSGLTAGQNTIQIRRVGNLVRALVFIARDGSGVRSDGVFPDPIQFTWDGMTIQNYSQRYHNQWWQEKTLGVTRPTGVFVLPFNHGGEGNGSKMGNETPDLWLPTVQSSRIEINGVTTTPGAVQVATFEVAPIEQVQTERYEVPNSSAFKPAT